MFNFQEIRRRVVSATSRPDRRRSTYVLPTRRWKASWLQDIQGTFSLHFSISLCALRRVRGVLVRLWSSARLGKSSTNPPPIRRSHSSMGALLSERCFVDVLTHKGEPSELALSSYLVPLPSRPCLPPVLAAAAPRPVPAHSCVQSTHFGMSFIFSVFPPCAGDI